MIDLAKLWEGFSFARHESLAKPYQALHIRPDSVIEIRSGGDDGFLYVTVAGEVRPHQFVFESDNTAKRAAAKLAAAIELELDG